MIQTSFTQTFKNSGCILKQRHHYTTQSLKADLVGLQKDFLVYLQQAFNPGTGFWYNPTFNKKVTENMECVTCYASLVQKKPSPLGN